MTERDRSQPSWDGVVDPGRPFRCDWSVTECTHGETLTGPWRVLSLELSWERTDPFAVTLVFPGVGNDPAQWVMARSLLTQGLTRAAGVGDVRVRPLGGGWVVIGLRPPQGGELVLAVPRRGVERFLDLVEEQVPPDLDTMIDVEVRGILGRAWS